MIAAVSYWAGDVEDNVSTFETYNSQTECQAALLASKGKLTAEVPFGAVKIIENDDWIQYKFCAEVR